MIESVRLAKRLVEILACSRREAELYITGGWVRVDGEVVEEPQFKVSAQKIELHPDADLTPVEPATILLHQPAGLTGGAYPDTARQLISPATRSPDDDTGVRLLKSHFLKLSPTLPLEQAAGGLVAFTQDWRVARKLSDDAAKIEQEYIVEVRGELKPYGLALLNHGLEFDNRPLAPIKVSWQNETRLRFALKGVRPGQIAQMCKRVGLEVTAMKRIRIGGVPMKKLPPGQWRYLSPAERF